MTKPTTTPRPPAVRVSVPAPHGGPLLPHRRDGRPCDAGMSTAEYAVGTVAACGFAGVLYKVLTSGAVQDALSDLVRGALAVVS